MLFIYFISIALNKSEISIEWKKGKVVKIDQILNREIEREWHLEINNQHKFTLNNNKYRNKNKSKQYK